MATNVTFKNILSLSAKKISRFLLLGVCVILFNNCSPTHSENTASEKKAFVPQRNPVNIIVLKKSIFKEELVSNGKLSALQKSELKFGINGQLHQLYVHNGQVIKKNMAIAELDPFEYQQQLDQAETTFRDSHLELRDELIGRGYAEADSTKIPEIIWEGASVRSGYTAARRDLKTARYQLAATTLKAPFTGRIANIERNVYEQVTAGEVFCLLINDLEFEVNFQLVESEILEVKLGDEVQVIPYSLNRYFKGYVSQINPVVDEHGLVNVKARVKNAGALMEGMNVKVLLEKEVPDKLVVPKTAVVLRQNQEVLFKYVNGRAFWTYVQTGLENSTSYTVERHPEKKGKLAAGDTVIISGNLNLAHESDVVLN